MKELKKIITATGGEISIYENSDGSLTTARPIEEDQTYKQFLVTDDPSQYALGTGLDDFEKALQFQSMKRTIGQTAYIIELHYAKKDNDSPPIAVFVYDENLKRTRII